MAIYCPIIQENVLYLDCKDCEDTDVCRKLKLCGSSEDTYINEQVSSNLNDEGDIKYEQDR